MNALSPIEPSGLCCTSACCVPNEFYKNKHSKNVPSKNTHQFSQMEFFFFFFLNQEFWSHKRRTENYSDHQQKEKKNKPASKGFASFSRENWKLSKRGFGNVLRLGVNSTAVLLYWNKVIKTGSIVRACK